MSNYRTIKVRPATYRALKVLAATRGQTMLDLLEQLVQREGKSTPNTTPPEKVRRGVVSDEPRPDE